VTNQSKFSSHSIASICLLIACSVITATHTSVANAQLTQNITIGNPKALGLAHAVTADPPGIDAIHFNPAGLAKIKGRQRMIKVLGAHMSITGHIGENQTPDDVKTNYCVISQGPGNACSADQEFANSVWDEEIGTDASIANHDSATSTPLLMLPGSGLTDVPFMIVPFGGIAFKEPSSGWTLATSIYSPMAIGYKRESSSYAVDDNGIGIRNGGDPGELNGKEVAMARITYFSPSIGIQINEELAIGASIGFSWHGFGIVTDLRAPLLSLAFLNSAQDQLEKNDIDLLHVIAPYDYLGELTMEMEDILSLSFNLGLLWEPSEWLAFGVVYQSEAKSDMEGDFKMVNTDQLIDTTSSLKSPGIDSLLSLNGDSGFNAEKIEKGKVTSEQIVPAHLSIGTSIRLLPNLKLNFDVKWTEYSAWNNLTFEFDQPIDFLTLASTINALIGEDNADSDVLRMPRNYQDVVSWAVGIEYQANDNLVFRTGYEPRGSAIPNDAVDLMVPLTKTDLYSFGIGYQIDSFSRIDASIAYLHSEFSADIGESKNANDTQEGQVIYNPYAWSTVSGSVSAYIFALSYEESF